MRVKLNKRFQKKIFYNMKGKKTWSQLSEDLGIKTYIIKDCALSGNTIQKNLYDKIRTKETDKFVIDILDDNWGRKKGGENSIGSVNLIKFPKKNERLAEFFGIMLGDGNIYVQKKTGNYQIRIAFNGDERSYIDYVNELFYNLFKIRMYEKRHVKANCIYLCCSNRETVKFLD